MTEIVDKIYVEESEDLLITDFINFFLSKKIETIIGKELENTFSKIKPFLKNRFVKMNNGYCFDREITGCWLGLCENYFPYMDSFNSYNKLSEVVKKIRKFYGNNKIDLPTLNELLELTNLTNAPFSISKKRPSEPSCYILYQKENKYVQGFDTDRGYLKDHNEGHPLPIYRLYKKDSKISDNRKIFLLWIYHKLKPIGFEDDFYDSLLKSDFELDDNLNITKISKFYLTLEIITELLKKSDKIRADLIEYDSKIFSDVNKGSWEVFESLNKENFVNPLEVSLTKPIVARNPKADIVDGGVVGIDFGTKSTVVVYSKDREKSLPMRVGVGDWNKKESARDYENPTVMEFVDLESFLESYEKKEFRPHTKWNDLTISHRAYEDMKSAKSSQLNAFLTELKQWAGDNKRKLKIEDKKENIFNLPSFEAIDEAEFNPIEIYAYYLGLYINNQFNGIYLNYLLSFPVTYDFKIREKILKSFEKGLKKSLPDIKEKIEDFRISGKVSEPAAYAAVALEEYEIDEERNFYAIFDFGGGTCDFDFGIFRWADEKNEKRYDYVIESFGAGGDKFLGGENLLELLAFYIFKDNKDILLQKNISFIKHPEEDEFTGSERLLSDSRESKLNMINLINEIRGFWEREEIEEGYFEEELEVDLYDNDGNLLQGIQLVVDEEKLLSILRERIKKGVDNFFEALREAFLHTSKEISLDVDKIHILLAGNSSKSPIVKELFEEKIEEVKKEMGNDYEGEFILYPPLDNEGNFEKPSGKTGVAFGLIATRPGGRIKFIDRNVKKDDIKFKFYLGINKRKKFRVVIDREIEYNKWVEFIDAGEEFFEVYYTSSPLASSNKMKINDNSIKRKSLKINKIDENLNVYVKVVSPNKFVYAVGNGRQFFDETEVILEEN